MKKLNLLGQQLSNEELKNVMAGAVPMRRPILVCVDGSEYVGVCMSLASAQSWCTWAGGPTGYCQSHGGTSSCTINGC